MFFLQIIMDPMLRQQLAERVFTPRANALPVVQAADMSHAVPAAPIRR